MGLQELLLLYPGQLISTDQSNFTFDPLVQTGKVRPLSFFDVFAPVRRDSRSMRPRHTTPQKVPSSSLNRVPRRWTPRRIGQCPM
jgi:hypothetical protein